MKTLLSSLSLAVLAVSGCIGVSARHTEHAAPASRAAPAPPVAAAPEPVAMVSLVRKPAPDFSATAVLPDNSIGTVTLSSHRGSYVVLVFYPADFTFVCPTELIALDDRLKDFEERDARLIAVSVDSQYSHLAWKNTPREKGGIGAVRYPLVADVTKGIARSFGILLDESVALRALFIIDTKGIVRHALVNDLPIGRNVDDVLRTLDAIAFVDTHGDEVCPAGWRRGQRAVKTTFEGIADYLSKEGEKKKE